MLLMILPKAVSAAGTTWKEATQLPLGQEQKGSLSKDRTEEFWKFTVTEDGAAKMIVTPDNGLRIDDLRLYYIQSDGGNYWARTSNAYYINPGWYQGDFTAPDLAPGTYLLKVHRGEGEAQYTIKVEFTPSTYTNNMEVDGWDPNGDEKPCALPLNTPTQGHLGYGYDSGDNDKEDWWSFTVTEDGQANINIKHEGTLRVDDLRLYYIQSDGKNYWSRTDHNYYVNPGWYEGNLTTPNLAPGTYILRVRRGEGYGGYELTYTLEAQAYKNDTEPNDEWNDGRDNNYLPRGHERQGHLGYGYEKSSEDDYDFYRITVPRNGKVNIIYTPATVNSKLRVNDIRFYYIQSDANNYWSRTSNTYYIDPGWYAATLSVPDVAPGDYLVRLRRAEGYGAYSLKYEFEQNPLPDDGQPANDWKKPTTLPEGKTLSGHLGYGYANGNEDSEDWYEVTMTKAGTLTINVQPGDNLRIDDVRLYYYNSDHSNCHERTKGKYYINPGWYFGSLITDDVEPGDYLVRVRRGEGYGNYRIAFNGDITDVDRLDPLPDEQTDDDPTTTLPSDGTGTEYKYDPESETVTISKTSPTAPFIIACGPFDKGIRVKEILIPAGFFKGLPPGDVSVGAKTPPTVIDGHFDSDDVGGRTLHVPIGTVKIYENHPDWGKFGNIKDDYGSNPEPSGNPRLIVWLKSGEKVIYELAESPVTTFADGQLIIRTNKVTVPYERKNVLRYTYEDVVYLGIDLQPGERQVQVNREGSDITFRGLPDGTIASVYTVNGTLVGQFKAIAGQPLTVSLQNRPHGVYIVKAATETIKLMKQ